MSVKIPKLVTMTFFLYSLEVPFGVVESRSIFGFIYTIDNELKAPKASKFSCVILYKFMVHISALHP